MTQTWAIFVDAYRSLNAKKMFWFVLGISGLVVACFAGVGINERGIKLFLWQIDLEFLNTRSIAPAVFYKQLFVGVGISFWLSWLATILALISTAEIFPDLMTSGSITLFISKPIARLRLFLIEYVAGLLFVALQVTVFTAASFLLIGLRGGTWEPGLFVAIPIVVCFFSYLFSVCVFLGVLTRSTLASLLLTLLFWFVLWGIGAAEETLLALSNPQTQAMLQQPGVRPSEPGIDSASSPSPPPRQISSSLQTAHRLLYAIKTVVPKTTETIAILERSLTSLAELPERQGPASGQHARDAQRQFLEIIRGRSVAWIVGTSLLFEAVVVASAAWLFCRRDF